MGLGSCRTAVGQQAPISGNARAGTCSRAWCAWPRCACTWSSGLAAFMRACTGMPAAVLVQAWRAYRRGAQGGVARRVCAALPQTTAQETWLEPAHPTHGLDAAQLTPEP